MSAYYGLHMLQMGQTGKLAKVSSATPVKYVVYGRCEGEATDKEALLINFHEYAPISNDTRYECIEINGQELDAFVGSSTNLVLHFDLLDGVKNLVITDVFKPLDLVATNTAYKTAAATFVAGTYDSLGSIYIPAILDGEINKDKDIAINTNLRWNSLTKAYFSNLGDNDKGTITQTYVDGTKRTGFLGGGGLLPTITNLQNNTTWSHLIRIRVVSTAALTCIGKTLALKMHVELTTSELS